MLGAARPPVDVVVPFRGDRGELRDLVTRLTRLELRASDTIVVVDNTPGAEAEADGDRGTGSVRVVQAVDRFAPGYARNRGAELGSADWIVFIDADTTPASDLLDCYFDPLPAPQTVLLAGGVIDEPVPPDSPGPARYAHLRHTLSQDRSLGFGRWSFVQTSNMACRRQAFESVGGFREDIRAAEDADLSYRVDAPDGGIERREAAAVVHRSRRALRPFIAQAALYGGGVAWLNRQYPGSWPPRRRPGLVWWAVRYSAKTSFAGLRSGDRDLLVLGIFDPVWELAFEFGRSRSIEAPGKPEPGRPSPGSAS